MPKVVIEEFVPAEEGEEDTDHKVKTHHEIDDVSITNLEQNNFYLFFLNSSRSLTPRVDRCTSGSMRYHPSTEDKTVSIKQKKKELIKKLIEKIQSEIRNQVK